MSEKKPSNPIARLQVARQNGEISHEEFQNRFILLAEGESYRQTGDKLIVWRNIKRALEIKGEPLPTWIADAILELASTVQQLVDGRTKSTKEDVGLILYAAMGLPPDVRKMDTGQNWKKTVEVGMAVIGWKWDGATDAKAFEKARTVYNISEREARRCYEDLRKKCPDVKAMDKQTRELLKEKNRELARTKHLGPLRRPPHQLPDLDDEG